MATILMIFLTVLPKIFLWPNYSGAPGARGPRTPVHWTAWTPGSWATGQAMCKHDHFRNGKVFVAAHFCCNHLERLQNTADLSQHGPLDVRQCFYRIIKQRNGCLKWFPQLADPVEHIERWIPTSDDVVYQTQLEVMLSGCICCCNDRSFSAATVLRWKCATMAFTFIYIAARVATPFWTTKFKVCAKQGRCFSFTAAVILAALSVHTATTFPSSFHSLMTRNPAKNVLKKLWLSPLQWVLNW